MKALIPAAGRGTRFLPLTKAIPKEMLPIGAKPAIQVIAEEARDAGADEVIIVTSPDKPTLRTYFAREDIGCKVTFCDQTEQKGLGHAVLMARPLITDGDPVLILLGDALVSGEPPAKRMAEISRAHHGASVIGFERVPREKVSRYGIAAPIGEVPDEAGVAFRVGDLIEKPAPDEAPSDYAVAGRYLLDAEIFALLETQTPGKGGEIQLTDAIRRLLKTHDVWGYRYPGKRQDIGNPDGYFAALEAFRNLR